MIDRPRLSPPWLCIDVGFTRTRAGFWSGSGFGDIANFRTVNTFVEGLESGRERRAMWLDWIASRVARMLENGPPVSRIGLCLPGPVQSDGSIAAANSIWGDAADTLTAGQMAGTLKRPVTILNDLAAAAVRYGESSDVGSAQTVIVVNVGSGIGAKLYDRRSGRVVLGSSGRNGEIGFTIVDESPDAHRTDDGLIKGTLGLYASGSGFAKMLRTAAAAQPSAFAESLLAQNLGGRAKNLQSVGRNALNEKAVLAIGADDPFVTPLLARSIGYLAKALHTVILFDAPEKLVITGGFACAVGALYRDLLCRSLKPMLRSVYSEEEIDSMVVMGRADNLDNLIGLAGWMKHYPAEGVTGKSPRSTFDRPPADQSN